MGLPFVKKLPEITAGDVPFALRKILESDEFIKISQYKMPIEEKFFELGEFLLDSDDLFYNKLIEKSETILSNPTFKALVIRHFLTIQLILNLPQARFFDDDILEGWITSSEIYLINALGIEMEYLPINKRVGPMWRIYTRHLSERIYKQ